MDFNVKPLADIVSLQTDCLVIPVSEDKKQTGIVNQLDDNTRTIFKQLQGSGDINGKCGDTLLLHRLPGFKAKRVLLLGTGKGPLSSADFRKTINALFSEIKKTPIKEASLLFDNLQVTDRDSEWQYRQLAQLALESTYLYQETKAPVDNKPALGKLTVFTADKKNVAAIKNALATGKASGNGTNVARHLGNLPANICTPTYLADQAKALARKNTTIKVDILEEKQMKELGMLSLLSVTAGTEQPAKLIVINYKGENKKTGTRKTAEKPVKPYVLVGKGITFDSGGISLKPGAKMDEMKYDMCGAASVLGTMTALAELNLPVNVTAIIAAAENLPGGSATKPGDVIKSMSGQTIEILNTDAEGRLVLCDALTYAEKFKPKTIIDIATLTGACVVALGKHASGLYSNHQPLADQLLKAGESSGDRAWQMPLWDEYQSQLDSNFADIANIGGPEGGSITAACFLSRFTKKYQWAHLDIAGTAWVGGAAKGATGRPVPLLLQYLLDQC
jgi:leucyl aminopeptidase